MFAVFIQYQRVTDRQTDGRTDGQTDSIAISISRVSVLTRDKNQTAETKITKLGMYMDSPSRYLAHQLILGQK